MRTVTNVTNAECELILWFCKVPSAVKSSFRGTGYRNMHDRFRAFRWPPSVLRLSIPSFRVSSVDRVVRASKHPPPLLDVTSSYKRMGCYTTIMFMY